MQDFKKTDKQVEAIKKLGGSARHVMLFGGSRSGKTFIAIYALIVRACKEKESRHIALRLTFNSIKTSIWMDTLPKVLNLCFPNLEVKFHRTDYYISFPNGSELWIGGLDDAKRVEKILGKEFSTIYFNECSQLNYAPIQIALTRLAQKNKLRKKAYYDCNPANKTHFAYWLFMKKLDPLENEPLKRPDNYDSILMNPKDNLENIDDEYLEMLSQLPEKERDRFLNGLFSDASDGQAYYSFDREKHVQDIAFTNGALYIGMDFNVAPMTAVIFQFVNNKFHILDEAFLMNSDTYKMCDYLLRKKYRGNIIPDSTGRNRKTSGKSDHDILKENGFKVMSTHNPFVTDRVNNVNRLLTSDRIVIHPRCKKLINDLEKVSWKDNKLDQKTDSTLTHISDALGYGLWKLEPISSTQGIKTHTTQR